MDDTPHQSSLKTTLLTCPELFYFRESLSAKLSREKSWQEGEMNSAEDDETTGSVVRTGGNLAPLKRHLGYSVGELELLRRTLVGAGASTNTNLIPSLHGEDIEEPKFLSFVRVENTGATNAGNSIKTKKRKAYERPSITYDTSKQQDNFLSYTASDVTFALHSISTAYGKSADSLRRGRESLLTTYASRGRVILSTALSALQEEETKTMKRVGNNKLASSQSQQNHSHNTIFKQINRNNHPMPVLPDANAIIGVDMRLMDSTKNFVLSGVRLKKDDESCMNPDFFKELSIHVTSNKVTSTATNNYITPITTKEPGVDTVVVNLWKKTVLSNASKKIFNLLLDKNEKFDDSKKRKLWQPKLRYKKKDEVCFDIDRIRSVVIRLQTQSTSNTNNNDNDNDNDNDNNNGNISTNPAQKIMKNLLADYDIFSRDEVESKGFLSKTMEMTARTLTWIDVVRLNSEFEREFSLEGVEIEEGAWCWGLKGGTVVDVRIDDTGRGVRMIVSNLNGTEHKGGESFVFNYLADYKKVRLCNTVAALCGKTCMRQALSL